MQDLLVNRRNGSMTKSRCVWRSALNVKFASAMPYYAFLVISLPKQTPMGEEAGVQFCFMQNIGHIMTTILHVCGMDAMFSNYWASTNSRLNDCSIETRWKPTMCSHGPSLMKSSKILTSSTMTSMTRVNCKLFPWCGSSGWRDSQSPIQLWSEGGEAWGKWEDNKAVWYWNITAPEAIHLIPDH